MKTLNRFKERLFCSFAFSSVGVIVGSTCVYVFVGGTCMCVLVGGTCNGVWMPTEASREH